MTELTEQPEQPEKPEQSEKRAAGKAKATAARRPASSGRQRQRRQHTTTLLTKEAGDAQRGWHVVDLEGKILGRAACTIASVLRGKHKPTYTPHVDMGDFVVVVNADKIELTGAKWKSKLYRKHTGYMGGLVELTAEEMRARKPEEMIRRAVWGMLPKGRLGRKMIKKLKIYAGPTHKHEAQQPQQLAV